MLEFNVDKQAGIQLHTCERKSRWCKSLLLLSWLVFLGWLAWSTFFRAPINSNYSASMKLLQQNCSKEIASSIDKGQRDCASQLASLRAKQNSNVGAAGTNNHSEDLNQQLSAANQKIEKMQQALQQSNEKLKMAEASAGSANLPKNVAKKLYFYEKILDVNSNKDAVLINHFAMKSGDKPRHYRFQLLLAKSGKSEKVSGSYDIFIKGNRTLKTVEKESSIDKNKKDKGNKKSKDKDKKTVEKVKKESVTYKHTGLLPAENVAAGNSFSFDFYQDLQGDIVLPENFELESISVSINPKKLSSLSNSYEWKNIRNKSFKEVL